MATQEVLKHPEIEKVIPSHKKKTFAEALEAKLEEFKHQDHFG